MGSLGSTSVNAIMKDALPAVRDTYQILFVTGKNNYEEMRKQIHAPHVKVVDYVKQLDIMAQVDLIVCRSRCNDSSGNHCTWNTEYISSKSVCCT